MSILNLILVNLFKTSVNYIQDAILQYNSKKEIVQAMKHRRFSARTKSPQDAKVSSKSFSLLLCFECFSFLLAYIYIFFVGLGREIKIYCPDFIVFPGGFPYCIASTESVKSFKYKIFKTKEEGCYCLALPLLSQFERHEPLKKIKNVS